MGAGRRSAMFCVFLATLGVAAPGRATPSFTMLAGSVYDGVGASALSPDGTLMTGFSQYVSEVADPLRWTRASGWSQSAGAGAWNLYEGQAFRHLDISRANQLLYRQLAIEEGGDFVRIAPEGAEPSYVVPMPAGCEEVSGSSYSPQNAWISDDGSAVAANAACGVVHWSESGGSAVIRSGPADAVGFSDDGLTIAGGSASTGGAYRWTAGAGLQSLDIELSDARLLSGDGSAVGGLAPHAGQVEAFVWDAVDGVTFLGVASLAAISADGDRVVGNRGAPGSAAEEAVVWTRHGTLVGLGQRSRVTAMTPDGRWAIGALFDAGGTPTPFLWDLESSSVRTLEAILADLGVDVDAILPPPELVPDLGVPTAISDDGTTILGGIWVAVIPEPGTAALVAMGVGALASARTRRCADRRLGQAATQ